MSKSDKADTYSHDYGITLINHDTMMRKGARSLREVFGENAGAVAYFIARAHIKGIVANFDPEYYEKHIQKILGEEPATKP